MHIISMKMPLSRTCSLDTLLCIATYRSCRVARLKANARVEDLQSGHVAVHCTLRMPWEPDKMAASQPGSIPVPVPVRPEPVIPEP